MANKKIIGHVRGEKKSPDELKRLAAIREAARQEFPPAEHPTLAPASSGVGAQLRAARLQAGLTWYAVAKQAGIPNPSTVRDIECGRDAKLSNIDAIAKALGLRLSLEESPAG